ncbi:MAG TPA: GreA/GreB family elongation factor [Spirochaetota bacterium]|nr:GreA/GreB family elongation factor [Spirochaetota bacterium]HOD14003.1 GreA/GreB family elongation factor [Spirochaetota bacterium]HPN13209.1 GreA/GreB family elongation factor [Spirochaetota bacterium]HQL83257.1 GreA/GreB family elongation factor [Spirochaetota bacterium]
MRKGKIFTRNDYERLVRILDGREAAGILDANTAAKLKRDLEHSRLVDPRDIRPNIVTMNSKICLKNIGNGKKEVYSLVFPGEGKGTDALSVFSGIGTELLGSTIGTVVKKNPAGEQYFVIEDIIYQPEAAGDYHL